MVGRAVNVIHYDGGMDQPSHHRTLGEILGHDRVDTPEGIVFRRYMELSRSPLGWGEFAMHDRYLWLIATFHQQVMGGGIEAFLCNSSGEFALDTLEALRAIGAKSASAWLKTVCEQFPNGVPHQDQETRTGQVDSIVSTDAAGRRARLDTLFPGTLDANLHQILLDYWRREQGKV